jgi:pimeloyl-ACP methyl ester carboxylesterase
VLGANHFVRINGLRQCYREWGDRARACVVLVHGGSAHAHWWDVFAATLADTYHVLAPNLRGHGDSEHCDPPAYQLAHYVEDLRVFIEVVPRRAVALVGHSLGGSIATAYSAAAPHRVQSLVVVDSALKMTPRGARYMTRLRHVPSPVYNDREEALRRFGLLPAATTADTALLRHMAGHGIRALADGRWTLKFDRAAMGQHAPYDLTPALERIRCPILFVRGAESTVLTSSMLAALRAAAPHAEVAEVAGAHHHVMLDNPPGFARAVRDFLDRTVRHC